MFKKLALATAIAALTAGSTVATAHSGFYIGADAGGNYGSWTTQDNNGVNVSFNSQGLIGTLFAGYSYNIDHFFLGLEGFFNQASNKSGTKNLDGNTVQRFIRQKYGYGLSLLPGIAFNDMAAIFLRAGVVRTNFQIQDSSAFMATPGSSTNITGSQFGGGLQMGIASNFDIRLEYVYSMYNSSSNANGKFTPRDSQGNLGLVYSFG